MSAGRTMEFQDSSDARIESLTKEQVDAVLKKVTAPENLIVVTAGDFSKAVAACDSEKEDT
ncbi:MAG: hypothetical protein AAF939_18195 [Planctomycetota bacterium]